MPLPSEPQMSESLPSGKSTVRSVRRKLRRGVSQPVGCRLRGRAAGQVIVAELKPMAGDVAASVGVSTSAASRYEPTRLRLMYCVR